jgi:hypothetical protein
MFGGKKMKNLGSIVLSLSILFFLTACNNDSDQNNLFEVNGPGGSYVGAEAFEPAMVAGQTIYTFHDKKGIWTGVTFLANGMMHYQNIYDLDHSTDYSIVDGEIVVNDGNRDPVIHLMKAQAITWKVHGKDNDGRDWQDEWHLQLKFKPEMLIGKRYLSNYDYQGQHIVEKVYFTKTTLEVTTPDGNPKHAYPYRLENGTIIASKEDGEFTLNLMFPDEKGGYGIWYASPTENYANISTWSPIR